MNIDKKNEILNTIRELQVQNAMGHKETIESQCMRILGLLIDEPDYNYTLGRFLTPEEWKVDAMDWELAEQADQALGESLFPEPAGTQGPRTGIGTS